MECAFLIAVPFDRGAMLIAFLVEVAEDEFGLLEEAAYVVPDQWLDYVSANARVVAG